MTLVNLGGIVPLSTIDWIGRTALVVFLRGCPLRCPHCQNQDLQEGENWIAFHVIASRIASQAKGERIMGNDFATQSLQIDLDEASERVISRPFVDALVLSGGEPLVQDEACGRLFRLGRSMDLCTGLETSGCYPDRLQELLKKNLVDRVFLDIKAAINEKDYQRATGKSGIAMRVQESLEHCMENGVPLDVRTTIFPEMPNASEVFQIAKMLLDLKIKFPNHCLKAFILQQGRPRKCEPRFEPVTIETLNALAKKVADLVDVRVRASPRVELEKAQNYFIASLKKREKE